MLSTTEVYSNENIDGCNFKNLDYNEKIAFIRENTRIIILDLYETLIWYPFKLPDSLKTQYNCGNLSKNSMKYLNNVAQTRDAPVGTVNLLHGVIPKENDKAIAALEEYTANNVANTRLYGDQNNEESETLKALGIIKDNGYILSVLSNLGKEYKGPYLKYFPEGLFDHEIFSFEVGLKKPDKDLFDYLLKEINLGKKDEDKLSEAEAKKIMVVVGNKLNEDLAFAENAGIPGILINRKAEKMGYDEKRRVIIIRTLYDLLDILGISYKYS